MATLFWEVLLCGLELTQARPTCGGPGVGLGPCVWGCARNRKKNRLKLSYALVRQSPYAELRPDVGADRPPPVLIPGAARGACFSRAPRCTSAPTVVGWALSVEAATSMVW